jgi:hypothetical protein
MVLRLATPRTALALGVFTLLATAGSIVATALDHSFAAADSGSIILIPGYGLVGFIVARRQPRNPIGWCMLGSAAFLAVDDVASSYSVLDYHHHGGRLPLGLLAVLLQPAWAPAIVLLATSIVLFPDGTLPPGWWRIPLGAFFLSGSVWLVGAYGVAVSAIAGNDIRIDSGGNLVQGDHPSGNWAWWGTSQNVFFVLLAVIGLSWLGSQIPAYRRATGTRRAQLKWLLSGAGIAIVGGVAAVSGSNGIGGFVGTTALLGLPVAIGIGITRYRLYDIDRIISRTLAYALLTALLVGVFVGLVLLTTHVLPFSSPVGVAASTLAAAALFTPLRNRLQRLVDRRFNRARYDAEATVTAFGVRLRDAVDPETVLSELAAAAGSSLQPAHVSVWVRT